MARLSGHPEHGTVLDRGTQHDGLGNSFSSSAIMPPFHPTTEVVPSAPPPHTHKMNIGYPHTSLRQEVNQLLRDCTTSVTSFASEVTNRDIIRVHVNGNIMHNFSTRRCCLNTHPIISTVAENSSTARGSCAHCGQFFPPAFIKSSLCC